MVPFHDLCAMTHVDFDGAAVVVVAAAVDGDDDDDAAGGDPAAAAVDQEQAELAAQERAQQSARWPSLPLRLRLLLECISPPSASCFILNRVSIAVLSCIQCGSKKEGERGKRTGERPKVAEKRRLKARRRD